MRKTLLFLLLFGAGLAVVLWLRGRRPPPALAPPRTGEPSEFTEVDVPSKKDETGAVKESQAIGVRLDGRLSVKQFGGEGTTQQTLYELDASDVDLVENDAYDLKDLEVGLRDPQTSALRARLRARRARARFAFEDGKPRVREDLPIELETVELTLFEGAPVVPLTFTVPNLSWQLGAARFTSQDDVKLAGRGLAASGRGLDVTMSDATVRLIERGEIRLDVGQGAQAVLSAQGGGPIVASRDANGHVDLAATESARLSFTGARTAVVDARSLHIVGRTRDDGATRFELEHADAVGGARLESQGDVFSADRADFTFTAAGELAEAVLTGNVVLQGRGDEFRSEAATFVFGTGGRVSSAVLRGTPSGAVHIGEILATPGRIGESARAEIAGAGPLQLTFERDTRLDLAGPGELRIPELALSLKANGALRGFVAGDRRSAELFANDAVELSYEESDMTTESLAMRFSTDAAGAQSVDATTEGLTRLHGAVPGERPIVLEAREGLSVRAVGDHVVVPLASTVHIARSEPDGFDARAQSVRDFDWRARTFVAQGAVTYDTPRSRGEAETVTARGEKDLELEGTSEKPARYRVVRNDSPESSAEVEIQAQRIRARENRLEASGRVRTIVAATDRSYELDGETLEIDLREPAVPGGARTFRAHATGAVAARLRSLQGTGDVSCADLVVEGELARSDAAPEEVELARSSVRAEGDVRIDLSGEGGLQGACDLFTLDPNGRGRLAALPGKRVQAAGTLARDGAPYDMLAEWIEFDAQTLDSAGVEVRMVGNALSSFPLPASSTPLLRELSTDRFHVDESEVRLEGHAHVKGDTVQGETWWLDAGALRLRGRWIGADGARQFQYESIEASGGFDAGLAERAHAHGEKLSGVGGHVRIDGEPARLVLDEIEGESSWIEYDMTNMLLATDRGTLRPSRRTAGADWTLTYESMKPFDQGDTTILVMRNPVFRRDGDEMRADWTLFWVDRDEWIERTHKVLEQTTGEPDLRVRVPDAPPEPSARKDKDLIGPLRAKVEKLYRKYPVLRAFSEIYVEGNIEYLRDRERTGRASAVYVDLVETRGWLQDADLSIDIETRDRPHRLRSKAKWLHIMPDGLAARDAVVTSCTHDEPHYVIKTGDFRITLNEDSSFTVAARENELGFGNTMAIPMPALVVPTNEKFVPILDKIAAGNLAKFGTSVQASFNFTLGSLGRGIGRVFGKLLDFPDADLDGHWRFRPGYLGSRGVILGTGIEFEVPDKFKLDMGVDGIPDRRRDRGLIRVPTEDRDTLRTWFRSRGRYYVEPDEWFDLALSYQSDPGVQSEFFERDFLEYEQKDNYLHWRKAHDQYYFNASAKVLLEDRTDVEELPSVGAYRGLTPIAHLGSLPLLYRANLDAAYLRRKNGDPQFYAPFEPAFSDSQFEDPAGIRAGERDVLRVDTTHRLETPFALGFAGLRATPFVAARATVWDEGIDASVSPRRAGLFAGVDFATTIWRRYGSNTIHSLSPVVSVHADVMTEEANGEPVPIDRVEDPIDGRFIDLGLRSRLWKPGASEHFDLEARLRHGDDLPEGQDAGFQPVATLSEFLTFVGDVPVGMTHDGRYSTENGDTVYSRTFVGFEPHPKLGIELGYHRGLDEDGLRLYEAASLASRYRATKKWEIELDQTISIADDRGLGNSVLLRRIGHDFILETEVSYRAGEGASFNFNVIPDLSWKRSSLGLIDRWLGSDR